MTTASSPPTQIELHLLSFDASGAVVADWLRTWLSNRRNQASLWLLLEQMHRFDFEGTDVARITPLITEDSLGVYGLRGRLFWETGQIEWRRLSPDNLRVVVMTEGSMPIVAPEGVKPITETCMVETRGSRLILWGTWDTSRDGGAFREMRVAGSADIDYPAALGRSAAGIKGPGTIYPVLPSRTYVDKEGKEQFRRFLPSMVCDEQTLRQSLLTVIEQTKEVQNA